MTTNQLAVWMAICDAPVLGTVGHRRTYPAGPAHPTGTAPAWVTSRGCDLGALHAAHSAHVIIDRRGEGRECMVSAARVVKPRRSRKKAGKVVQIRRSA